MKPYFFLFFFSFIFWGSLHAQPFQPKMFCFEDAFLKVHTDSSDYQAELLNRFGFDGMELMGLDSIDNKIKSLEKYNLRLFMVYIQIDMEKDHPYDPRLPDFIKKMKDRGVTLWLHVHSDKYGPSDPLGDKQCVAILQDLADFANDFNVSIALYPHYGFWLEKVEDAVRLTKKINRRNVGAVFNLCHFLKADEKDLLEIKLKQAIPFLSVVSINGADDGNTNKMDWTRLIQPLGKGSYDVIKVLRLLRDNNFSGPVGLQCYNIPGEPADFLKLSIETWQKYMKELSIK
jgi:sugar phosphate isomerase/epimerase